MAQEIVALAWVGILGILGLIVLVGSVLYMIVPNAEICDAAPPAASESKKTVNGAAFTSSKG